MKMVKNIAIVAFATSFMFAGIGFHMANNYSGMDEAAGASVTSSYGATFELNGTTSVGYDSHLGMLMTFAAPAGVSLRLGWLGTTTTSVGLGFTWWNGGDGLNTSISTSYDMVLTNPADATVDNTNDGNLSVTVGFGF